MHGVVILAAQSPAIAVSSTSAAGAGATRAPGMHSTRARRHQDDSLDGVLMGCSLIVSCMLISPWPWYRSELAARLPPHVLLQR